MSYSTVSTSKSFLTKVGRIVKKITGIRDISSVKKQIHKTIGKLIYHKKYSAKDVVDAMRKLGLKPGSLVCIHSSMKEFYNYQGTAKELIDAILDAIGSEGTLMMPAFPRKDLIKKPNYVFDIKNDPTGAGFLAETFRQYPGVKRSINVQHSVCAIGRLAEDLVAGHENSHDCWDASSPWQFLCRNNGLVFNFGMPGWYIGTFEHCVESILRYEHPYYAQFFTKQVEWHYFAENGAVKSYKNSTCDIDRRTREQKVRKFFSQDEYRRIKLSNLAISLYQAGPCLKKMLDLGRQGITIYYVPDPKRYRFS